MRCAKCGNELTHNGKGWHCSTCGYTIYDIIMVLVMALIIFGAFILVAT